MTETDGNKSFETIDLIAPVPLAPIGGFEEQPNNTEKPIELPVKKEDVPIVKNNPAGSSDTSGDYQDYNRYTGGYQQDNPYRNNTGQYYQYGRNTRIDPKRFFRQEAELRQQEDEARKRRNLFLILTFFIIFAVSAVGFFRGFLKSKYDIQEQARKNKADTEAYSKASEVMTNQLTLRDDVFECATFDTDVIPKDAPVIFNPEVVQFTSMYKRALYYRVAPTEDNLRITVFAQMTFKDGSKSDVVSSSVCAVPKGEYGIVPIFFNISPTTNLDDVSYSMSVETQELNPDSSYREIISTEEVKKGHIRVMESGTGYLDQGVYIIFYKDGEVATVMGSYGEDDGTGKSVADIYIGGIDYDTYVVYY